MTLLAERQKARRVKAMAGVTGHRSGSDTDKIKSEFAAQKATSAHSSEVLGYLANLPTTGHNAKLRKQARKFMGMRGHGCKPGEHMTFGVCRKVGEDMETVRGIMERVEAGVLAERAFHFTFRKGRHGSLVAEPVPGVSVELEQDGGRYEVVIYDDDGENGEVASRTPLAKGIEQGEAEKAAVKIYTDYMWQKDDARRTMGESVDPARMTQQQFWAAIDRASGNKFVTSETVDWGTSNRGQGRRRGGMVMGGMSDAPKGKKSYADPLGKAPLTKDEMEEASSAETGSKVLLAKALEAGFSSAVAFLVSYTVGKDAIGRDEAYQLASRRSVKSESADLDWDDLESEVRDLVAVVRRKKIQEVLEAVDRINDLILKHVEL